MEPIAEYWLRKIVEKEIEYHTMKRRHDILACHIKPTERMGVVKGALAGWLANEGEEFRRMAKDYSEKLDLDSRDGRKLRQDILKELIEAAKAEKKLVHAARRDVEKAVVQTPEESRQREIDTGLLDARLKHACAMETVYRELLKYKTISVVLP